MYNTAYITVYVASLASWKQGYVCAYSTYLVNVSTVSGMGLTASTVTVPSWILRIKPSPSLLQGSKVELHPLAHAQFASLHSVQRLSPKKGASDKNSHPGLPPMQYLGKSLITSPQTRKKLI